MSASTFDLMITVFLFSSSLTFIFGLINWFYSMKLMSYIKQTNSLRYHYLYGNALAGFGDPITNFLILWNYLYSDEDNEDDIIRGYKNKMRIYIKYFLISGLLLFLIGILLLFIDF